MGHGCFAIHCDARNGQTTVKKFTDRKISQSYLSSKEGKYRYSFSSLSELMEAGMPPLILNSIYQLFGGNTALPKINIGCKNERKVWDAMNAEEKAKTKEDAKAIAIQKAKDAEAIKAKKAEEKAKADEVKKEIAAKKLELKAQADKEKAEKKEAAKAARPVKVVGEKAPRTIGTSYDEFSIHLVADATVPPFKGKRDLAFSLITEGMGVKEFKAQAAEVGADFSFLRFFESIGLITLKASETSPVVEAEFTKDAAEVSA